MRFSRGGMIENPPFVVPVQISREFEQLTPLFTGVALDIITQTANKNQVRALFKELMENDDKALAALVQTIADLSEFYIIQDNIPESRVLYMLTEVGQMVVNGFLAQAIQQYPQEFERYLDEAMVADMRNYMSELDQEISRARRGASFGRGGGNDWGGRGGGGGRTWQAGGRTGGGWGGRGGVTRASRWDEDVTEPVGRPSRFGNEPEPRGQWGRTASASRSTGRTIWDDAGRSIPSMESSNRNVPLRAARDFEAEAEAEGRGRRGTVVDPPRRHVEPTNPNATIVGNQTFVPLAGTNQLWPKVVNTQRPWDWILVEDGRQIRPAHQSDWKVTFNPEQPVTPHYNPQTHVLFHFLSADGKTVVEDTIKRNETMNYLDHELDPKLRMKAEQEQRDSEGKVVMAWKLVESLAPQPDSPLATDDIIEGDADKPALVVPDEHMLTLSLPDAVKRAGVLRKLEKSDALERPFELYADRAVMTTVVNPDFNLLFELTNADSFRKAYQLLSDLPAGELHTEVNKRLTAGVNHALSRNIGLKNWSIDSFEDDIGDLIKVLGADFGDSLVKSLEENAVEIISRALCHFTRSELDQPELSRLLGLPEDAEATVLVWRERASITHLPVTALELVVPKNDGVLVSATNTPDFHKTIAAIFNRTPDVPHVYYRRYLATADGVVYELVRGYVNDAALMLYRAEFSL